MSDVGGAILGREAQTQQNWKQIGQRADVNRKQKLEDDELKRFNKKIRGHMNVMIDAGEMPEWMTKTDAAMLDVPTLEGMLSGRQEIEKRGAADVAKENIQSQIDYRDAQEKGLTQGQDIIAKQRTQLSDLLGKHNKPFDLPDTSAMTARLGRYNSAIAELRDIGSRTPAFPAGEPPDSVINLRENIEKLERMRDAAHSYAKPNDTPERQIALGGREPTKTERLNAPLMAKALALLEDRAKTSPHDLSEKIKHFRDMTGIAGAAEGSPELKLFLQSDGLEGFGTAKEFDPNNPYYTQGIDRHGREYQVDHRTGKKYPISQPPQAQSTMNDLISDDHLQVARGIDALKKQILKVMSEMKQLAGTTVHGVDNTAAKKRTLKQYEDKIKDLNTQIGEAKKRYADLIKQ